MAQVSPKVDYLIGLLILFITICVTPQFSMDPINLPKFLILIVFGTSLGASLLMNLKLIFSDRYRKLSFLTLLFMMSQVLAFLISPLNKVVQLFGVYGRNTGLLTYLSFMILLLKRL